MESDPASGGKQTKPEGLLFSHDDLSSLDKELNPPVELISLNNNNALAILSDVHNFFAQRLGEKFIIRINNQYKNLQKKNAALAKTQKAPHPMALMWAALLDNINRFNGIDKLHLPTIKLVKYKIFLENTLRLKNSESIVRRLKDPASFYSGIFEAKIAANYLVTGYNVAIPDDDSCNPGKTWDFSIRCGDDTLHVECKSLKDYSPQEYINLHNLAIDIIHLLGLYKLAYRVIIFAGDKPSSTATQEVIDRTKKALSSGYIKDILVGGHNIELKFEKIADWDKTILTNHFPIPPAPPGIILFDYHKNKDKSKVYVTNIREVTFYKYSTSLPSGRIINAITKARKQLPPAGPGAIHLNIPIRSISDILNIYDRNLSNISNLLQKNTTRVNAVVFSAEPSDYLADQWEKGFDFYRIIPNLKRRTKLPKSIKLLGSRSLNIPSFENKGQVVGIIGKDVPKSMCCILFQHVPSNGLSQAIFWHTIDGRLRIELITKNNEQIIAITKYPVCSVKKGDIVSVKWDGGLTTIGINDSWLPTERIL